MPTTTEPVFPDGRDAASQPAWRKDFPIDLGEDEYVSRRDFAKFLVLISGAMAAGQVYLIGTSIARRSQPPHEPQPLVALDQLEIGGVYRFDYPEPNEPCLLARLEDGTLVAFGQECTHLSCAVVPDLPAGRLICPCHKGYFDVRSGQPLAGPPRRPLPRIKLEIRDGMVYATGVELRT
jgi:Rieske Fe-S protein